jgi:hypothetical protein
VRNVAAALALAAPEQDAVFGLIYDAENPYFAGSGDWPGWPDALRTTLEETESGLRFRAVSWQDSCRYSHSTTRPDAGRRRSTGSLLLTGLETCAGPAPRAAEG